MQDASSRDDYIQEEIGGLLIGLVILEAIAEKEI